MCSNIVADNILLFGIVGVVCFLFGPSLLVLLERKERLPRLFVWVRAFPGTDHHARLGLRGQSAELLQRPASPRSISACSIRLYSRCFPCTSAISGRSNSTIRSARSHSCHAEPWRLQHHTRQRNLPPRLPVGSRARCRVQWGEGMEVAPANSASGNARRSTVGSATLVFLVVQVLVLIAVRRMRHRQSEGSMTHQANQTSKREASNPVPSTLG